MKHSFKVLTETECTNEVWLSDTIAIRFGNQRYPYGIQVNEYTLDKSGELDSYHHLCGYSYGLKYNYTRTLKWLLNKGYLS